MQEQRLPDHLAAMLKQRADQGLMRSLRTDYPPIDFCSNDYLGFSRLNLLQLPESGKAGGSGGSRLISGNSEMAEATEQQIADFHQAESALLFNSGYDANLGLLSSVPQKGDLILFDEAVHASLYDGIRLSQATRYKFRHNDVNALKELAQRHQEAFRYVFIVVESLYSMDGDAAPLKEIVDFFKSDERVFLIVDEAHAIGIFGKEGRGLCNALDIEPCCFARVYTYGKAMGCHGAAVTGSAALRQYLINFARSFIYTTALPAHSMECIQQAYRLLPQTEQREQLLRNITYFCARSAEVPGFVPGPGPIQAFITGSAESAGALEALLEQHGIYAKAIKSPTVKEGSERLRISLHAYNTQVEMDQLIGLVAQWEAQRQLKAKL